MADQADPKKPASGRVARLKGRPRGPSAITQGEVARVIKAVQQVGAPARVEVTRTGISIVVLGNQQTPSSETNSWDEVYAADKNRSA